MALIAAPVNAGVILVVTLTILLYVHRREVAYYRRGRREGGGGGGGGGGGENERVKARLQIPPEKDRRDRGPPPEQWKR